MPFQRARTEEQREERRRAILAAAAAMLADMPVEDITLNELSRRVGLAKSNVLRYVESREAVLLDLMHVEVRDWLGALEAAPAATGSVRQRTRAVAALVAETLAARAVLGNLLGEQFAVLERNVSAELAGRHKRATLAATAQLADEFRRHVPELRENADTLALAVWLVAGTVWTAARPNEALLAAFAADPALEVLHLDMTTTLRDFVVVLAAGLLDGYEPAATHRDVR